MFDIGGKTYTLQIVGFVPGTAATCSADDDILANFVTGEDHKPDCPGWDRDRVVQRIPQRFQCLAELPDG